MIQFLVASAPELLEGIAEVISDESFYSKGRATAVLG
jgi:hypothetical protein